MPTVRDRLLIVLAVAAGVVDAMSLLALGVFTAAITANVVLVGIAFGTGDPHTALRAGLAIGGFALGVLVAARLLGGVEGPGSRPGRDPRVLACVAGAQAIFLAIWLITDGRPEEIGLDALAIASAFAMGGQTAAARAWHTGITTTYISGTLTLLINDLAVSSGSIEDRTRRFLVVFGVAAGATVGALVLTHAREVVAAIPLALTLIVAAAAERLLTDR